MRILLTVFLLVGSLNILDVVMLIKIILGD